jgi:SSS family solute:Na+ symporter
VHAGKIFGTFLAVGAMVIAPFIANAPQGLFGYLQEVNGCYSIPILTIILVGIFSRRVPPIAAKIGLASGVGLYIVSQFILKPALGADGYPHYLHVMFILFVLNVCIMLLIGGCARWNGPGPPRARRRWT